MLINNPTHKWQLSFEGDWPTSVAFLGDGASKMGRQHHVFHGNKVLGQRGVRFAFKHIQSGTRDFFFPEGLDQGMKRNVEVFATAAEQYDGSVLVALASELTRQPRLADARFAEE